MIRRVASTIELKYIFDHLKFTPEQCLNICRKLYDDLWNPTENNQFILNTDYRSEGEISKVLMDCQLDDDQAKMILGVLKPFDGDLSPPDELLRSFVEKQKVAVFVGAGASRLVGVPGWEELASKAINFLSQEKNFSHQECEYLKNQFRDPKEILSIFHKKVSLEENNARERFYRDSLKACPKLLHLNIYQALAQLDCLKVTTNLDDLFTEAISANNASEFRNLDSSSANPRVSHEAFGCCVPSGEVKDLDNNVVYHLHGTLRTLHNAIMTMEDYVKAYYSPEVEGKQSPVFRFLSALFRDYTVLFIGSSLSEFVILERILGSMTHITKQHFALLPVFSNQLAEFSFHSDYLTGLKIKPVPYYLDDSGYRRLHEVVTSWSEKIQIESSKLTIDKLDLIKEAHRNG